MLERPRLCHCFRHRRYALLIPATAAVAKPKMLSPPVNRPCPRHGFLRCSVNLAVCRADNAVHSRPDAQSGGPGMSALTPLLGAKSEGFSLLSLHARWRIDHENASFALHRWVLHLDPVRAPAGLMSRRFQCLPFARPDIRQCKRQVIIGPLTQAPADSPAYLAPPASVASIALAPKG